MRKYSTKCLTILLTIVSTVSLINVFVMYWFPINIPLSSFSAVRLTFVAFIEKRYYLILVSALICVLLFLSTLSVRRQHIILPGLSLLYLTYDFIIVLSLFMGPPTIMPLISKMANCMNIGLTQMGISFGEDTILTATSPGSTMIRMTTKVERTKKETIL